MSGFHRQRHGITLVELLVVLAIIMVIVALVFPVMMITMQTLEETRVSREIKLLDQACEQFKTTFGQYPSGKLLLCEDMRGYVKAIDQHLCQDRPQTDPMHQMALARLAMFSMEYVKSIFPGIDLNAGHDWNGDGVIDDRQYFLSGSESLVYFLGGMRYGKGAVDTLGTNRSAPMGFNTDKTRPTVKTSSTRLGPFFEFEESRILYEVAEGMRPGDSTASPAGSPMLHDWTVGTSTGYVRYPGELYISFFPRYTDLWKTPYSYLRARGARVNNYTCMFSPYCYQQGFPTGFGFNYHLWFSDFAWQPSPTGSSLWKFIPCTWGEFVPYIQSVEGEMVSYYNPNRFQIISAGRDKEFGRGGRLVGPSNMAETSSFLNYRHFPEQTMPLTWELQANYDNITNINFARVVPR